MDRRTITVCAAVLTEVFFVQTKQQISGNTLCITGNFCEVWVKRAGQSRFLLVCVRPENGGLF